jgi:hypothetical protein
MHKYILTSILMINSALLMSQNIAQTNIFINQSNTSNVSRGNWLMNESRSNSNKPTNRNNKVQQTNVNRNIAPLQQFNNRNVINTNENVTQSRGRGNQNSTQSVVRNTNPVQVQRQTTNVQRGNAVVINEINSIENNFENIANEDGNPVFNNGNLQINTENVQNQQVQFLADNNDQNIQLLNPQINFEFNIEQKEQAKTVNISQPKEVKIKTFTPLELKPVNTRNRNSSSESIISETSVAKIKTEKTEKHKGGSSYSQKNKSYLGKKIKIWCKKNLKFAKKIRMSVSCPKF